MPFASRLARVVAAAALAVVAEGAVACGGAEPAVRLVTTTSVRDSKLLDRILPEVERLAGRRLAVVAVGTGQALEMARRGDADLVLVHDRASEDRFVAEGHGVDHAEVWWNDFVVVGPPDDPAKIRGGTSGVRALRAIAGAKAGFVSRGDRSGTHLRERSMWAALEESPSWSGYVESGQGQGPTLLVADERKAYALTDRGTWISMRRRLSLVVLVEGDPMLRNPYAVMRVNPAKHSDVDDAGARAAHAALTSSAIRALVDGYRVDGEAVFHAGPAPR